MLGCQERSKEQLPVIKVLSIGHCYGQESSIIKLLQIVLALKQLVSSGLS